MDKQILNFTVNEQVLNCENPIRISTNKVNYIQANFNLGENWDGFDSVRAVWFNDFNCISTVLDSLGNCVVPFEVMKRKGNVKVNLVGSISEDDVLTDRLTSYPVVAVIVDCTAQIVGSNTQPITPSEFEQFARRVRTDADRAETAASNAETSAQNASDSATSAHNSAESAHDDKIAIEEAIAEVIQQIEDFEQVQVVVNTLPPSSQATSDFTDGVLTLGIPQGVKGDTGNGIQNIRKTGTSGLVDTYTITFTEGQTTTFTVTNGAKGDTGNGISSIAKTSTVGLVDTYTITYTDGTTSTFTVTNGEKGDKGDQGEVSLSELEDATVVQTLSDSTPYNYRRTNGGQGSGVREYDEIVGASVGWNQHITNGNFADGTTGWINRTSGSLAMTASSNKLSCEVKSVSNYIEFGQSTPPTIPTHKYFISIGKVTTPHTIDTIYFCLANSASANRKMFSNVTSAGSVASILSATASITTEYMIIRTLVNANGFEVGDIIDYENIQVIDLTSFNSQIADYVYSLEQSTAGSGVTWLKSHFPRLFDNGYQPFDAGSIKSVSGLQSHDTYRSFVIDKDFEQGGFLSNGRNDEEASADHSKRIRTSGFVSVNSGKEYTLSFEGDGKTLQASVSFYADDDYTINRVSYTNWSVSPCTFTIPSGANYLRILIKSDPISTIAPTVIQNVQLEKGSTATPYTKHAYPLDSTKTLRGKYYLDSNNQLRAMGDVYKSSGGFDTNFGEVNLGDLNWTYNSNWGGYGAFYCNPAPTNIKGYGNTIVPDVVCSHYPCVARDTLYGSSANGLCVPSNGQVSIRDSAYTDAAAFKQHLTDIGAKLVYRLYQPTTETATPYTNPQNCESGGTEEYVGSELPVGHNTDYPMSLVDTMPKDDGSYTIQVDVANGKPSVSWVMPASASMIAPTETAYKATRNYTLGSLLIVNGTLYKVTANIANNGNIAPGTNCVATTLAEVISALA